MYGISTNSDHTDVDLPPSTERGQDTEKLTCLKADQPLKYVAVAMAAVGNVLFGKLLKYIRCQNQLFMIEYS